MQVESECFLFFCECVCAIVSSIKEQSLFDLIVVEGNGKFTNSEMANMELSTVADLHR